MKYKKFIGEKVNPREDALKSTASDVKKGDHSNLVPNIPSEVNKIMQGLGDEKAPVLGKKSAARDFDQYAKNAQARRDEPYTDSIDQFDDPEKEKRQLHRIQRAEPTPGEVQSMGNISQILKKQREARGKTLNRVTGKPAGAQVAAISENSALKAVYDAVTGGQVREIEDAEIVDKYFANPDKSLIRQAGIYNRTGQGLARTVRERLGLEDGQSSDEYLFENITGNDIDIPEEYQTNMYSAIQDRVMSALQNTPAGDVDQSLLDSTFEDYLKDNERDTLGQNPADLRLDSQKRKLKEKQEKIKAKAEQRRDKEIQKQRNSIDAFKKAYDSHLKDSMDPTDIALIKKADQERINEAISNIWDEDGISPDVKVGMTVHYLSEAIQNNSILPISLKQLASRDGSDQSRLDEVQLDPEQFLQASSMMFGEKENPIQLGLQLKALADGRVDFNSSSIRFPFSLQYDGEDLPGNYNYFVQQHQKSDRDRYFDYRKGGQKFEPAPEGGGARLGQIPADLGRQQLDQYNSLPEDIDFQDIFGFDDVTHKREIRPEVRDYWVNEIKNAFNYKPNENGIDFPMNPDMLTIGNQRFDDPQDYANALFDIEGSVSDDAVTDEKTIKKYFPEIEDYSNLTGIPKYIRGALQRVRTIRAMQNANDMGELKDMIGYGIARASKKRGSENDPYLFPHLKSHGSRIEEDEET